ncbi:MAG: hypothetical protein IT252_06630, partial [Chitinophagaceae bacterium]|nr:hypothetical protein [Chitinophagaceae bacterium]
LSLHAIDCGKFTGSDASLFNEAGVFYHFGIIIAERGGCADNQQSFFAGIAAQKAGFNKGGLLILACAVCSAVETGAHTSWYYFPQFLFQHHGMDLQAGTLVAKKITGTAISASWKPGASEQTGRKMRQGWLEIAISKSHFSENYSISWKYAYSACLLRC